MRIAKQNAKISDITLQALKDQSEIVDSLAEAQLLYLAVAASLQSVDHYGDMEELEELVEKVLEKAVDSRVVSWLMDDMTKGKPSTLEELENEQGKIINKAYSYAQKLYKPVTPVRNERTQQKTKKKS